MDDLQNAFKSKAGRNERPPRVGVNLIGFLAQVAPVQIYGDMLNRPAPTPGSRFAVVCSVCCLLGLGQLWRLLVASAVRPGLWTEERTDEGELVKYESRQLGGFEERCREAISSSENCALWKDIRLLDERQWQG